MDNDWAAVLRASYGEPVPLNPRERREVIYWLTRRGLSGQEIAERLGMSRRQVCRHRARLREAA